MPNRLVNAVSPYLRQHADNPVDWFPWGAEAFEQARTRDVPLFLSIGYSTCHWCHVMARESFADEATAAVLNDHFVSVKVDSEERPDINETYLRAVSAMTQRGGWPMSVFLTPDGEPFYAGSYWPRQARHGTPAFEQVLLAVSRAWRERRSEVIGTVAQISAALAMQSAGVAGPDALDVTAVDDAAGLLLTTAWDRQHGGFGVAPKFPHAMVIEWLLHRHARTGDPDALAAAVQALRAIARGGIHDHVGGGFSRYTVDAEWRWPHFEKMLYDNALLLPGYAAAAALTGDAELAAVARRTAGYLLDELRGSDGGFASASDADALGVEGGYYTWTHAELVAALAEAGVDPEPWAAVLGASAEGNWNGTNVLSLAGGPAELAARLGLTAQEWDRQWSEVRAHLLAKRNTRPAPGRERRVLCDWNALTVRGLVRAGLLLDEPGWVRAASDTAEFLHERLIVAGRLHHSLLDGELGVAGFLLDHAALALADLELFQATGEHRWFSRAVALVADAEAAFGDPEHGGWAQQAGEGDPLLGGHRETRDTWLPAGASVMVEVCLLLAGLTGEAHWQQRAERAVALAQPSARRSPLVHGWLLRQLEALAAGPALVAIVGRPGERRSALTRTAVSRPRPGAVIVTVTADPPSPLPMLAGYREVAAGPAAYVCRHEVCQAPVTTPAQLDAELAGSEHPSRERGTP